MGKALTASKWVESARSDDPGRPVLTGVHARDGWIEATDGHRLHVAPNEGKLPEGIWAVGTPQVIEGIYPETGRVLPAEEPTWNYAIADPVVAMAVARAAEVANGEFHRSSLLFFVSIPTPGDATQYVNPQYVRQVLAGMQGPTEVLVHVTGPLSPVTFFARTLKRAAVVMPVRTSGDGPRDGCVFSLKPFMSPIAKAAKAPA